MKMIKSLRALALSTLTLVLIAGNVSGDTILDSGPIAVSEPSGTGFLAGTATFNVAAADIPDVELLANFTVVDAGVNIVINGTSLFPLYNDISQFGPESVFLNTGESDGGGINLPFSPNDNGLPRLTVDATSAGTTFSGATFVGDSVITPYTPVFTPEDFSSLLVDGDNTIEFFVLNGFQGASLEGDFTVKQVTAVPEPATAVVLAGFGLGILVRRRRN